MFNLNGINKINNQMNNDSEKIAIAKRFEALYEPLLALWSPDIEYSSEDERYLGVFENLLVGVYGDCYGINAEYNDDGDLVSEATEYEVEVAQLESYGDEAEKFTFEIETGETWGAQFIVGQS